MGVNEGVSCVEKSARQHIALCIECKYDSAVQVYFLHLSASPEIHVKLLCCSNMSSRMRRLHTMIPVLRMFEVVVATAFYSGICYMIFEGTGELL